MSYSISDIGNWCSIFGFIITIATFFVTANVSAKVNKIQKSEKDMLYFNKKAQSMIDALNAMITFAESTNDIDKIFGIKQLSKIKNVITVVKESWDVLLPHENRISKKFKVHSWNKKMDNILRMYNGYKVKSRGELISFLIELETFLEKEIKNNE